MAVTGVLAAAPLCAEIAGPEVRGLGVLTGGFLTTPGLPLTKAELRQCHFPSEQKTIGFPQPGHAGAATVGGLTGGFEGGFDGPDCATAGG